IPAARNLFSAVENKERGYKRVGVELAPHRIPPAEIQWFLRSTPPNNSESPAPFEPKHLFPSSSCQPQVFKAASEVTADRDANDRLLSWPQVQLVKTHTVAPFTDVISAQVSNETRFGPCAADCWPKLPPDPNFEQGGQRLLMRSLLRSQVLE